MRVFQEEIFGPVLAVTTFKDEAEALRIANDTPYGLGAGVWTRDTSRAFRMGRGIQAGRVWTNCYHLYPARGGLRRLQELGRRPREPPDDARPLQPDEVPAGVLRPEPARVLLMPQQITATPAALELLERLRAQHGDLIVHVSGGCCDGSSPMCLRAADLPPSPHDVQVGALADIAVVIDGDQNEPLAAPASFHLDVAPGAAGGFSLDALDDPHFTAASDDLLR